MLFKKEILLLLLGVIGISCSPKEKTPTYTVIVSLDGFRWDYPEMYDTPHLDRIARMGVSATMQPSYPASTFPNHYTLATGLVPDHHGIVNNSFWDQENQRRYSMGDSATRNNPAYYGGEPIWITAQKQGVLTGNLYWVGSDIAIKDMYPTYFKYWAAPKRLTFEQRVDTALAWLQKPEADRPRLIMLYMEEPDGVGHRFGPGGRETGDRVAELDRLMGSLYARLQQLDIADKVNLIVTSDHGMTDVSAARFVDYTDYLKPEWIEKMDGSNPTSIFTRTEFRDSVYLALKSVTHLNVWKKEEIPSEIQYGSSSRIGDIVVAPEVGWQFSDKPSWYMGAHGYFPADKDMQVVFRACGPDFKENYQSQGFRNVDIYPLLSRLLDITPEPTDGVASRIEDLLR